MRTLSAVAFGAYRASSRTGSIVIGNRASSVATSDSGVVDTSNPSDALPSCAVKVATSFVAASSAARAAVIFASSAFAPATSPFRRSAACCDSNVASDVLRGGLTRRRRGKRGSRVGDRLDRRRRSQGRGHGRFTNSCALNATRIGRCIVIAARCAAFATNVAPLC